MSIFSSIKTGSSCSNSHSSPVSTQGHRDRCLLLFFERLGLRAASSLNVFSCAKWAIKRERDREGEYLWKVTQMQQKVHFWENMSSALFCNFVASQMLNPYVHNLQNCAARDAVHFVLQRQKGDCLCFPWRNPSSEHYRFVPMALFIWTFIRISNDNSFDFV